MLVPICSQTPIVINLLFFYVRQNSVHGSFGSIPVGHVKIVALNLLIKVKGPIFELCTRFSYHQEVYLLIHDDNSDSTQFHFRRQSGYNLKNVHIFHNSISLSVRSTLHNQIFRGKIHSRMVCAWPCLEMGTLTQEHNRALRDEILHRYLKHVFVTTPVTTNTSSPNFGNAG